MKQPDFVQIQREIQEKEEKFEEFYALLTEYNARFNLTAIVEREEVFHKHFLDSLAGAESLPQGAHCVEVGSGAGFPSIPLKLVRDDLKLTLIESTGKKCDFLRIAAEKLAFKNVNIVCGRAEELGKGELREKFDVCFARAVARLNTLAEYCMPLVKKGGFFLAYKGECKEETEESKNALSVLGGGAAETVEYSLPDGYGARTLVKVEKIAHTPEKYPRGRGLERRKPL